MTFTADRPLRVCELFAGYGSQRMALNRLKAANPGFDFNVVGISEIDKYALKAYELIHGDCPNLGDISKVDWASAPDFDLVTWSFPCQAISVAGRQAGLKEGSGTTSSLAYEALKCFEIKRPKFLLMENVSALLQKKFAPEWHDILRRLETMGYANFYSVMDTKDYGVPQHRERVFMVSILRTASDPRPAFAFPRPFPLERRLKDILEPYGSVPESYYLPQPKVESIIAHCSRKQAEGCGVKTNFQTPSGIAGSITGKYGGRETDTYIKESDQPPRPAMPSLFGFSEDFP